MENFVGVGAHDDPVWDDICRVVGEGYHPSRCSLDSKIGLREGYYPSPTKGFADGQWPPLHL